jgi:hypothetical protein
MLQKVQANPTLAFQAPPLFMPAKRPASSDEFDQAQQAGGYTEPAEKSGRPITYLMQKPEESYEDFMKRAVAHGKSVTPQQIQDEANQPLKAAVDVPLQVAKTAGTSMAALTAATESIVGVGKLGAGELMPRATQALKIATEWAKANPIKALAMMWLLNKGLETVGMPKASKIVEQMEMPALLLLGGGSQAAEGAGAAGAAEETAAKEAIQGGEEAVANKTAAAAAGEAPPASAPKPTAPLGSAEYVDQAAEAEEGAKPMFEDVETIPKEQRQAASDRYYAEHPEKRPGQPKIVGRGPKKGQQKTVRVFDNGTWTEVPVYK